MIITNKLLAEYKNGSYLVSLYKDGTKIRKQINDGNFVKFPESIDLKITNWCLNNCPFCHESSRKNGKHATIKNIDRATDCLAAGVETAIGGGNPLEHPQLQEILMLLKNKKLISNITINEKDLVFPSKIMLLKKWQNKKLIYGIGISTNCYEDDIYTELLDNVVYHCILGEASPFNILYLKRPCKVLLLGDKKYGRGKDYFAKDTNKLNYWKYHLPMILSRKNLSISFDNLAIEQLDLKNILSEEMWNKYYMGDDGQFTMYVDAVKMQYAKNSISERKDVNDLNIREMFEKVRKGD